MIQSERDFSDASQAKGIRDAFLSFISDSGILFRPGPVPGKKWLGENPPASGALSWQPIYADVSSAGDLGYTTGPYEYKSTRGTQYGTYLTLWKMQPDGTFKFVVDFGISHAKSDRAPAEAFAERVHSPVPPLDATEKEKERNLLLRLDRKFAEDSASNGIVRAFEAWSAQNIRILRDTMFPAVGKTEGLSLIEKKPGKLTWVPEKADIADSADLGFTYGIVSSRSPTAKSPLSGYYLRIWRKLGNGEWKVAVDAMN